MKKVIKSARRGRRGATGPKGERGERGDPGITPDALDSLTEVVEALRAESVIQLQRIAQLQAQLDVTLAQFRGLRAKRKGIRH